MTTDERKRGLRASAMVKLRQEQPPNYVDLLWGIVDSLVDECAESEDAWRVLNTIVAEFESDPMSVQCFDGRIVARAIELNRAHKAKAGGSRR